MSDMPHVEPGEFQKLVGYKITEWDINYAVISLEMNKHHANRYGDAHGGVLMTILDAACTRAGAVCPDTGKIREVSTVSMTTNFIRTAKDTNLRVKARKTGGGRRIFFATADAFDDYDNLLSVTELNRITESEATHV